MLVGGLGGGLGGGGCMRNPGPRGPERELKIPTLVRDVPRPLSPPRHRGGYRAGSYERDLPPSLMGVGQPVRGPGPGPGYDIHFNLILIENFCSKLFFIL